MRRFLLAGWIAVSVMTCTRAVGADDAQALLAKNKAFAGWVFGDPDMNGLRLSGKFGERQIVDLRRGAVWRRTITDPKTGLSYDIGYTGQRFWYSSLNGFTVPIVGDGAEYQIAYQMVMNQAIPLLSGTLHGTAVVGGAQTQIVHLTPTNADAIDAYIEPASGKLLRAVIDPDGQAVAIDVLGYTDLQGKKVISKWHVAGPDVDMTNVAHATIEDADFHPPAPRATWTFGPLAAIPITVSSTRIVVRVTINGVGGNFIFDSGSAGIAVNPDFADRIHLKTFATGVSTGLSGQTRASIGRIDTLAIGQNVLHDVIVTTGVNVHGPRQDFDGLLGFDFLADAIVDVDLQKQLMTIYDPSKYAVTAPGPAILVDLASGTLSGTPTVPVLLDGSVKGHFTFDTGDPMEVVASDKLYGPPHGVAMRLEGYAALGGAGGDAAVNAKLASCGHMNSIEIGPIKYSNVPVCFGSYSRLFGDDGGIIGLDFIKHFDLTFDYPDSALYLTPLGK